MAKKFIPGQMGLFRPESDWQPTTELPDLRGRPVVALDTEEKDEGLISGIGPGWALGPMGYIAGVSWAAEGSAGYAPVRHPEGDNLPVNQVLSWISDLHRSGTRVVYHNSPYDLGWLGTSGVPSPVALEDTLAGAVILDETCRTYSLDACCARAGVPGKDIALLVEAVRAYGGDPKKPAADLWRVPARYVAPYAIADAVGTLGLWRQQEGALRAQGLWDAYRTEVELIPMVVAMRRRGIRLHEGRARRLGQMFRERRDSTLAELSSRLTIGRAATINDVRSPMWLERVHNEAGIPYPRTPRTNRGSFSREWMEKHEHWLPRLVATATKFEEVASKFADTFLLKYTVKGRLHAEVHQFLSEEGGTRSHRFSYSDPPLQQMPTPDKDPKLPDGRVDEERAIGTLIRGCFLPEKGELWGAADYSGQEVRLTIHYAAECDAPGAEEAVARYIEHPRTDYHQMVADMTGLKRPYAKIVNFAILYGKGKKSLSEDLGLSIEETEGILNTYYENLPFAKALDDICKRRANARGYIRLIDGARMRYNEWDAGWLDWDERSAALGAGKRLEACSYEEGRERQKDVDHPWHGRRLRRVTRTALNNLIQGSAARQTKRAMLGMWREGILPLIQLHDEVGHSCGSEHQKLHVEEIMRDAFPLRVPVVVDHEFGKSWGRAKLSWEEAKKL